MRFVLQVDKDRTLRRQGRYLQPIRNQCMGPTLGSRPTLQNGIFAVDLDCRVWLKEEIRTSRET